MQRRGRVSRRSTIATFASACFIFFVSGFHGVDGACECQCMAEMGFVTGCAPSPPPPLPPPSPLPPPLGPVLDGSLASSWGVESFTKWKVAIFETATTGSMSAYQAGKGVEEKSLIEPERALNEPRAFDAT
jgi:hypothetical protein